MNWLLRTLFVLLLTDFIISTSLAGGINNVTVNIINKTGRTILGKDLPDAVAPIGDTSVSRLIDNNSTGIIINNIDKEKLKCSISVRYFYKDNPDIFLRCYL